MRKRRNPFSLLATTAIASFCAGFSVPQPIEVPQLDFGRLGDVLLAGDFFGISLLDYAGRETVLETPNGKDNIITQSADDVYVSSDFVDGAITASCILNDNRTVIIAGNFSKVLNESASGLAKVDLESMTASSLGSGAPREGVNALWCNNTEVFVGGSFQFERSYGVAVWNSSTNSWSSPQFAGFVKGSNVKAILPFGDNIVFGGTMKGLMPSRSYNVTHKNASDLLNPGMQPVSFNFANATGFGSRGSAGQAAPQLLCPYSDESQSSEWTADLDSTTGYINVTLGSGSVLPTRIRLFNLPDGSGTKAFRLVTEPANGIMNLSYTDKSGRAQSCSAYCPLPESNSTVEYHDFQLVNVVPTSSLRIELLDFYGSQAGLKGIQVFQEGQYAYANEAFNLPRQCGSSDTDNMQGSQTATSLLQGSWSPYSDYMTTNITDKNEFGSTFAQLSPAFNDYTVNQGRYAVQLWTPGCEQDNLCSQRGQVNVSVYPGFGSVHSTILYQTNNFEKYDLVYNGTLQDGAYIKISPTAQNQLPMQLVAYKANLIYVGPPDGTNASVLFEYSPANFSSNSSSPVGRTTVNSAGEMIGKNASVNALLLNGTTSLLIGGSAFESNLSTSLLSLPLSGSGRDIKSVGGIDPAESVSKLYKSNGTTFALSNKETYSVFGNLSALSLTIGAMATAAPFNLNGTEYLAFTPRNSSDSVLRLWQPVQGFAPPAVAGRVQGHLCARYNLGNVTAYLGNLEIVDTISLGGGARLGSRNRLEPASLPFSFAAGSDANDLSDWSQMHKRASLGKNIVSESSTLNSVYGGVYINSTHNVIAGHFNATTSNNRTATNALIVGDNTSQPLPFQASDTIDADSSFYAVASLNSTVALGGSVSGNVGGSKVLGLLIYNASSHEPFANQAPVLGNGGFVSALSFKPNTSELIVGGQFSNTGRAANSSCNGICGYDTQSKKWFGPKELELGEGATVTDLVFETGNRLLLGGNFTVGDSAEISQVAVYDFSNNTLEPLGQLPGPVTSLVVLSNATRGSTYAVSGLNITQGSTSPYLRWYNSSTKAWHEFEGLNLQEESTVSGLSLVTLQNRTTKTAGPLSGDQALLISGQLSLSNNNQASVAVYHGNTLQSLYATNSYDGLGGEGGLVSTIYSQYGGNLKGGVAFNEGTSTSHPRPSQSPQPSTTPNPNSGTTREGHLMPVGHVVGIACGIGIGCVMVLTLLYLLIEFLFNLGGSQVPYQNLAQSRPPSDPMAGTKVL